MKYGDIIEISWRGHTYRIRLTTNFRKGLAAAKFDNEDWVCIINENKEVIFREGGHRREESHQIYRAFGGYYVHKAMVDDAAPGKDDNFNGPYVLHVCDENGYCIKPNKDICLDYVVCRGDRYIEYNGCIYDETNYEMLFSIPHGIELLDTFQHGLCKCRSDIWDSDILVETFKTSKEIYKYKCFPCDSYVIMDNIKPKEIKNNLEDYWDLKLENIIDIDKDFFDKIDSINSLLDKNIYTRHLTTNEPFLLLIGKKKYHMIGQNEFLYLVLLGSYMLLVYEKNEGQWGSTLFFRFFNNDGEPFLERTFTKFVRTNVLNEYKKFIIEEKSNQTYILCNDYKLLLGIYKSGKTDIDVRIISDLTNTKFHHEISGNGFVFAEGRQFVNSTKREPVLCDESFLLPQIEGYLYTTISKSEMINGAEDYCEYRLPYIRQKSTTGDICEMFTVDNAQFCIPSQDSKEKDLRLLKKVDKNRKYIEYVIQIDECHYIFKYRTYNYIKLNGTLFVPPTMYKNICLDKKGKSKYQEDRRSFYDYARWNYYSQKDQQSFCK